MKTTGIINYGFQIHSSSPSSASIDPPRRTGAGRFAAACGLILSGLSMGRLFFMIVAPADASGSLRRKQFFVFVFVAGDEAGCPVHWRMHKGYAQ
jgi:hypothetical protein